MSRKYECLWEWKQHVMQPENTMYRKFFQPLPAIPEAAAEQEGIYLNAIRFVMSCNGVNAEAAAGLVLQELDGYASGYLAVQVHAVASRLIGLGANPQLNWGAAWAY